MIWVYGLPILCSIIDVIVSTISTYAGLPLISNPIDNSPKKLRRVTSPVIDDKNETELLLSSSLHFSEVMRFIRGNLDFSFSKVND